MRNCVLPKHSLFPIPHKTVVPYIFLWLSYRSQMPQICCKKEIVFSKSLVVILSFFPPSFYISFVLVISSLVSTFMTNCFPIFAPPKINRARLVDRILLRLFETIWFTSNYSCFNLSVFDPANSGNVAFKISINNVIW